MKSQLRRKYDKVKSMTGCTYKEIGDRLGCTKQYVYLVINKESTEDAQEKVTHALERELDDKMNSLLATVKELKEVKELL